MNYKLLFSLEIEAHQATQQQLSMYKRVLRHANQELEKLKEERKQTIQRLEKLNTTYKI